jgi:hypothetical protein
MKVALLFVAGITVVIWSVAPAKAAPPEVQCASWSGGVIPPAPCHRPLATNFETCRKYPMDRGAWWWCTSQHYTK